MTHTFYLSAVAVLLAGASMALSACTTSKDFGDQMGAISKDWKQSEAKVEKGEKLVRDGRSDIKKGENNIEDGAREERKLTRLLEDANNRYLLALASIGKAATSDEISKEASDLREIEKSIDRMESDLKSARSLQVKGQKQVKSGKSRISKGERLINEGAAEMKAIEADYKTVSASIN
ncbi:MAG: hypothetical protein CMK07_17015 [Ponticaulis sp.]|nr:hypothetical protein [Ponticaulis sp.]